MNLLFLPGAKITDDEGLGYLAMTEDELTGVSHIAKQTLDTIANTGRRVRRLSVRLQNMPSPSMNRGAPLTGIVVTKALDCRTIPMTSAACITVGVALVHYGERSRDEGLGCSVPFASSFS
jgi:hypothetical protein